MAFKKLNLGFLRFPGGEEYDPAAVIREYSVNVSSVVDLEKLESMKKLEEISEISPNDKRLVKDSVVSSTIRKIRVAEKNLASGKTKLLSQKEFSEWCKKL